MAYETELANITHQTDVVAGAMTEAFNTLDNAMALVRTEVFPTNTNVILFGKSGSLTAVEQTESSAWTYAAEDELTDTETTVTGVKKAQAAKITLETMRFGGPFATLERVAKEQARAMNALFASELKTLFSSIATQVTATSILTKDDLMDARYNVVKSTKSAGSPKLVAMLDYKGVNELGKELTDTDASAFVAQVDLGVLGIANAGTPKGDLFDVVVYETDGLPTSSSDDIGMVFDSQLAFVAGVDGGSGFNVQITAPTATTPWVELYTYSFWHVAEHNDTAACGLLSDT